MTHEREIRATDGRILHVYDDGAPPAAAVATVISQNGTSQSGGLLEPLRAAIVERRLRWISYDRPGYAGSTRHAGATVRDAVADVVAIADSLDVDEFAVQGYSGGGPPSLACAALLPDRVTAAVVISGIGPFNLPDWYDGMGPAGEAELRAAAAGEPALREFFAAGTFDAELFCPSDHEALSGEWGFLGTLVEKGLANGLDGMVDDDLSYVGPWGFEPASITVPVLFVHGTDDRIVPPAHSSRLAEQVPEAELRLFPGEGHVSIMRHVKPTLDWILDHS